MKKFFVCLTTFALVSNSFAANLPPVLPSENLNTIVSTINAKTYSYKNLIEYRKSADQKTSKEVETFYLAHPNYQSAVLPKASIENNKIVFMIGSEKASFAFEKLGLNLVVGDKTIFLDYSLTVAQIDKTLAESLNVKQVSYLNFFINDAQAFAPEMTAILLLGILLIYTARSIALADNFKEYIGRTLEWCNFFEGVSPSEELLAVYIDTYNRLSEKYTEVCIPGKFVLSSKGYSAEACKVLPEVKRCVKRKIEQKDKTAVDDSSRKQTKIIHYDDKEDRYFSAAAAK
jgi:hypothetical protein